MKINEMSRAILKIALPAIVTNITTPILGLVDLAIVGHFGDASYIGAIAVGSSLFNMVYWLLNFLRAGTSGLTAQAVGGGHEGVRRKILRQGMKIGGALGVTTLLLSPLLAWLLIPFMEADAATAPLAEKYFMTAIWGAPAYLTTYVLSGWLLGNQDSVSTLWIAIVTNVTNIALSLTLVGVFSMKIEGVALGTAVSQWIGLGTGILIIRRKYGGEIFKTLNNKQGAGNQGGPEEERRPGIGRFFRVNLDIMLRTACLIAVTLWFTRTGARYGADILAANALLMQLFMLFSFFMDGFAYAGEAISGKYLGAGEHGNIFRLEGRLLLWGAGLATAGVAIYFFAGEGIIGLLTDDLHVRDVAKDYLPWAITIPLMGFMAFVYDGIFIGMTQTRQMLVSMCIAMGVYFLLFSLLRDSMGNHALWLAFSAYLVVRGGSQWWLLRMYNSKLRGYGCNGRKR